MRAILVGILVWVVLQSALFLYPHTQRSTIPTYAPPPRWIVLCGIQDQPCVTYIVAYHLPPFERGDSQSKRVTDYERKTILLTWSNDRFKNVEALEHEVIQAALWERGFRDPGKWAIRDWLAFSDEALPLLLHDNPEFTEYLAAGY